MPMNAVKEMDNSQPPPGVAEGVAAGGSAASFAAPSKSEQHTSEKLPAASAYLGGLVRAFNYTTSPPPPVKDKAQLYKEELQRTQNDLRTLAGNLEAYKYELRRSKWELRQASNQISELLAEKKEFQQAKIEFQKTEIEFQKAKIEMDVANTTAERYKQELIGCKWELLQAKNRR
ncbi:hypothetical protein B0H34DRAFT_385034 [Crassisporium funariophilum]|nr:hypothetical protein B0H34DRAFT_385034 [Crassisporium funariophilum]